MTTKKSDVMSLTFLQRAEESLHYIQKFSEYLRRGVLGGDPNRPEDHTYAIKSPFLPEQATQQSSSTAPMQVAFYADKLADALNAGETIEALPQIRRHFSDMSQILVSTEACLARPELQHPNAAESISVAQTAIKKALDVIDRQSVIALE